MPINPIQRTHTQMHASLRLHVLLVLVLMLIPVLMPPLLYFPMHRCQCRTQTIMALHQLPTRFTHTQTGCICTRIQTTQHACTLFSLSLAFSSSLSLHVLPLPLSLAPAVSCHPSPFICPLGPLLLACIASSAPQAGEPRLLDTEDARTARRPSPRAATALRTAQVLLGARYRYLACHRRYLGTCYHCLHPHPPVSLLLFCFFALPAPTRKAAHTSTSTGTGRVLVHPRPQCMDGPGTHTKVAIPPPIRRWA
ncbi:hypothetical protein LI328DRAFT_169677 [Trichoderma asperelloides]|nr:hypothetical protein LI328DRAFT_169677 [Trichoderma asperelloides]